MGKLISELQEAALSNLSEGDLAAVFDTDASPVTTKKTTLKNLSDFVLAKHKLEYAGEEKTVSEVLEEIGSGNVLARDYKTAKKYKQAMYQWFVENGVNSVTEAGLTELVDRWYTLTRDGWSGGVTFAQPSVTAVSTGTRVGDNAGLTCTPSTNTVKGQDDYEGLPLFACVDCNFIVDATTLEPVITAIDGITGNFERRNPEKFVGVLQMAGFIWWNENTDSYTVGYSARRDVQAQQVEAVPDAVRIDGTIRPWVVHAKYMSRTVNGKLTSYAGVVPTAWISHNSLHTLSNTTGPQYSGGTTADDTWLRIMAIIKYASLTMDGIIQGCLDNNFQKYAAKGENGVRRILLTAADAEPFEVGMGVLAGNYAGNTDRGQGTMYSITGQAGAVITAIESVTIDGTTYKAIYLDTASTFNTTANGAAVSGSTCISTFHWPNGTNDTVLGNDGSIVNPRNGKYPGKLQGIEFMPGGYEVFADVILNLYQDGGTYYYEPYFTRRSAKQSTGVTSDYVASGLKLAQPASDSWNYIKKNRFRNGVFFPESIGGSSSTFTRDAFYQNHAATGTREWLARCFLYVGTAAGGLSALFGVAGLGIADWFLLARLSAGGNRGEWAA